MTDCIPCHSVNGNRCVHDCDGQFGRNLLFGDLRPDTRSPEEIKRNHLQIARNVARTNGSAIDCEICGQHFLPSEVSSYEDNNEIYESVCQTCRETEACEQCGNRFKKDELSSLQDLDGETQYEYLCDECKDITESEAEPKATVVYSDEPDSCMYITDYRDDTEGDFRVSWHSTDGWRGYYEVIPSDNWRLIQSDCSLWGSYDSAQLEEFDQKFRELLESHGIRWARVMSRTSNVFSSGYDFFVEAQHYGLAMTWRTFLALHFRDPERFQKTALTGADPAEWSDTDDKFYEAYKLVQDGFDPKDAVEQVTGGDE